LVDSFVKFIYANNMLSPLKRVYSSLG